MGRSDRDSSMKPDIDLAAFNAEGLAAKVMGDSIYTNPLMLGFAVLAYCKIPDRLAGDAAPGRGASVPLLRLTTLTAGVFCLAGAGPADAAAHARPAGRAKR